MKRIVLRILLPVCVIWVANADSFLTAQSFPKTFNDLSFVDRIQVLEEGYEPYEAEFEPGPNGTLVCVRGCPYHGINIQDYEDLMQKNTEQALAELNLYQTNFFADKISSIWNTNTANCVARHPDIPINQIKPIGEPVVGTPTISSPFGRRVHPIKKKTHTHTGIDYSVASGTYVYTTANGTVEKVWHDANCGNGLKIKYATGISAIFCHLERSLVSEGQTVSAGCAVAISDNSGASTGPHLHYGMKNKNDLFINPSQFTGRAK